MHNFVISKVYTENPCCEIWREPQISSPQLLSTSESSGELRFLAYVQFVNYENLGEMVTWGFTTWGLLKIEAVTGSHLPRGVCEFQFVSAAYRDMFILRWCK